MNETLPTRILPKLLFYGADVREQIAMSETNAFRLSGGSGSEDDLDQVVWVRGVRRV